MYIITKESVSSPIILNRFKLLNRKRPIEQQIKPFNFFLMGQGTINNRHLVKHISPMCNRPQIIIHKEFIDYKSGKGLQGEYWITF